MSRFARIDHALLALALVCAAAPGAVAASKKTKTAPAEAPAQRIDEEYTKLIKQYLQDPRITTELVDHMPASDTVPSPLKFFGRIPGTPGELTYAKDINRYYEALAKASPRAQVLEDRPDRRGPRPGGPGHRRRSHHQAARQIQSHAGRARRSAQNHRRNRRAS